MVYCLFYYVPNANVIFFFSCCIMFHYFNITNVFSWLSLFTSTILYHIMHGFMSKFCHNWSFKRETLSGEKTNLICTNVVEFLPGKRDRIEYVTFTLLIHIQQKGMTTISVQMARFGLKLMKCGVMVAKCSLKLAKHSVKAAKCTRKPGNMYS